MTAKAPNRDCPPKEAAFVNFHGFEAAVRELTRFCPHAELLCFRAEADGLVFEIPAALSASQEAERIFVALEFFYDGHWTAARALREKGPEAYCQGLACRYIFYGKAGF